MIISKKKCNELLEKIKELEYWQEIERRNKKNQSTGCPRKNEEIGCWKEKKIERREQLPRNRKKKS